MALVPKRIKTRLKDLRSGSHEYHKIISYIRRYLRETGKSFEDIGTSEEMIEKHKAQCCKLSAKRWLDNLRKGTRGDPRVAVRYIREEMKEGNLTYEDIGTSIEEMEHFKLQKTA